MSNSSVPPAQAIGSLARAAGRRVNGLLDRLGYRVVRKRHAFDPVSMDAGLQRAVERGISVGTVIDVGSSDGRWSDQARQHYPDAHYLLVEANPVHEPGLRAFKERVPHGDYVLAAAGDKVGELYFDSSTPFGGRALERPEPGSSVVRATTLDHEVETKALPGPYLVKLDTHGYEVPILAGAKKTLERASLLIIEVYNFTLVPGSLRFQETCDHVAKMGFRPIDLVEPLYRPKDGAFWQCDMFFARADRPEFTSNEYE